jgi:hypothetical protein
MRLEANSGYLICGRYEKARATEHLSCGACELAKAVGSSNLIG